VPAPQSSLRVDKGGGVPGRTMAEWLVDVGIDQPRTDRAATERVPLNCRPPTCALQRTIECPTSSAGTSHSVL
jgi:hypothetical protein